MNEAERWFERYLRDHGYEYEYEPDLGVSTRPDFLIIHNGIEVVCEVKGFEPPASLNPNAGAQVATGPLALPS